MRNLILGVGFGRERVYSRIFHGAFKPWAQMTDKDLRGFSAYTDLSNYCDLPLSRRCLPVATLRHPLYRAASLYHFVRRKQTHDFHELAMNSSLADFYRIGSSMNPRYFRNVQTSRICGDADARMALEYILTRYLAVGFTSQLDEFAAAMSRIFGWNNVHVDCKSPEDARYEGQITPEFRDMVLSQNDEDLTLFDAMMRGEPYGIPRPSIPRALTRRAKRFRDKGLALARGAQRRVSRLRARHP